MSKFKVQYWRCINTEAAISKHLHHSHRKAKAEHFAYIDENRNTSLQLKVGGHGNGHDLIRLDICEIEYFEMTYIHILLRLNTFTFIFTGQLRSQNCLNVDYSSMS